MKKISVIPILGILFSTMAFTSCNNTPSSSIVAKATVTVIDGTGGGKYNIGENATVTATVPGGKSFVKWQADGVDVSTSNPYTFKVEKDVVLSPVFEDIPYQCTVTVVNGTGSGTYMSNEYVTITATVPDGKDFKEWQVDGVRVSLENPYIFKPTGDTTYTAIFENKKYTLTVVGGTGSGRYDIGSEVTVTATLKEDEGLKEWQINGEAVSTKNPYTFTLEENTTIVAVTKKVNPISKYVKTLLKEDDKDFKILNLTDIQVHDGDNFKEVEDIVNELVADEKPDMITLLGDLLQDNSSYPTNTNWKLVLDLVDSYNIPWAPIFGNHDHEDYVPAKPSQKSAGTEDLIAYFNDECDNCLFTLGPTEVSGKSNYAINIVNEDGSLHESLIFTDSRLGGLDDTNVTFYNNILSYNKEINNDVTAPSILYTHIALKQYGDAYKADEKNEYRNLHGIVGKDASVLASGTTEMFTAIKDGGSTNMVICGHDHENAYYTDYEGVKLCFCMKSSSTDYANFSQHGGSIVNLTDEGEEFYNHAAYYDLNVTSDHALHPNALPYWKSSGASLEFDVELPDTGTIKMALHGTNMLRTSQKYEDRVGAWNRLSSYITLNAAKKTMENGTCTQIDGNKYHCKINLLTWNCNTGGGEVAYGEETARLVYMYGADSNKFVFSNVHYTFEEVTETDQKDLSDAVVDAIPSQFDSKEVPLRPNPKVALNSTTLAKNTDITYVYENNYGLGEATLRIVPSGNGAHRYKGEKVVKFNIIVNEDDDTLPGHENAKYVNSAMDIQGFTGVKDWYNSGKTLHFEVKRCVNGSCKSGETVRFSLMGKNSNPGAPCGPTSDWNRLTVYYFVDFSNHTVHKQGESTSVGTFTELTDGWWEINIPLNAFELNSSESALGNDKEEFTLVYFENVTRTMKVDHLEAR